MEIVRMFEQRTRFESTSVSLIYDCSCRKRHMIMSGFTASDHRQRTSWSPKETGL